MKSDDIGTKQATSCPFPMGRSAGPLTPPPEYDAMRAEAGPRRVTLWNSEVAWAFTRWQDVRDLLASPHFSAVPGTPGYPTLSPARASALQAYQSFITMDPPDHGYYRRMITKEFTFKRMQALRPKVQEVLDDLLDKMEAAGSPADLVAHLAGPLPSIVISLMLGVPAEYHRDMEAFGQQKNDITADPSVPAEAARQMGIIIDRILREREASPGNGEDLLSRLVIDHILPGHLKHEEAVNMVALLYLAGHETTTNQITLGTVTFLRNPDQLAMLRSSPDMISLAVDEMLRFNSIVQYNSARVATADVEIGGHLIRKGEGVYALITAANHDPEAFPHPECFDIGRDSSSHMAFSFGVHQCLGQSLARMELEVVFGTMFKRFPNLEVAVPFDALEFKNEQLVHGLRSLPVKW